MVNVNQLLRPRKEGQRAHETACFRSDVVLSHVLQTFRQRRGPLQLRMHLLVLQAGVDDVLDREGAAERQA